MLQYVKYRHGQAYWPIIKICTQAEPQSLSRRDSARRKPNQEGKRGLCFCACCERMRVLCSEFGPNLTFHPPKATFFAHLSLDSPHPWLRWRAASTVMTPT
jgi:hypothetical protein